MLLNYLVKYNSAIRTLEQIIQLNHYMASYCNGRVLDWSSSIVRSFDSPNVLRFFSIHFYRC